MSAARDETIQRAEATIRVGSVALAAHLVLPANAAAVVLHAGPVDDGRWLAQHLADEARFAALLVDVRAGEEREGDRFDLALLAQRLSVATDWVAMHPRLRWLPLAYTATGLTSAAAFVAASARTELRAIASRSGRPDLAGAALERVRAPTLLVVDEKDDALVALHRSARPRLRSSELAIIPREALAARTADFLRRVLE